jgi:molybdopterin biosynthesis enzyme
MAEYDMVVTTGGASVGDYDWAGRAAEKTGAEVLFRELPMKPGGSMLAAVKDGKVLLSLSRQSRSRRERSAENRGSGHPRPVRPQGSGAGGI